MSTWMEALIDSFSFDPVGAHNDGLDVSSAATLTVPEGAKKVLMQALTQNIRYTLDGTAPTTSSGFQMKAGDPPILVLIDANTTVKLIEEAATADLQYQFAR